MATKIYWQNEPYVIFVQFSGRITPEMLKSVADVVTDAFSESGKSQQAPAPTLGSPRRANTGMNMGKNKVHLVLGAENIVSTNNDIEGLRRALNELLSHPQLGWVILVTNNLMIQTTLNRVAGGGTNWRTVSSFGAANELLRRADRSIPYISDTYPSNDAVPIM